MLTKEDILIFLRNQKEGFFCDYQVVKLGLFGSFAKDEASESSDIDVLIEFQKDTPNLTEKKSEIRAFLQNEFNREVDLCREKYIKPYFRQQIIQTAIYV